MGLKSFVPKRGNAEIVDLDLPKGQLSAQLGTIPETLSRIFAKLSRDGLLEVDGSQIKLLDRAGLNQLVGGKRHP
jgi:CRP/FNR family transcriptional regulator, dissimilatory nitrate respiration regulator